MEFVLPSEFSIELTLISIEGGKQFSKKYENLIRYVNKLLRRCKVNYNSLKKDGNLEEEISAASDKHIIMMGASGSSPITKFLKEHSFECYE